MFGDWSERLLVSWNIHLKLIWQLPDETHRFFFEHLTECRHLKVLLVKRFLKFDSSIVEGDKRSCKLLLRTISENSNTITGKNIKNIETEAGLKLELETLKSKIYLVCEKIIFEDIPAGHEWKIDAAKEVALIKAKRIHLKKS